MVTIPLSARSFLRGQLEYFVQRGWVVDVVSAPSPREELVQFARAEGVTPHFIPLEREISLLQDVKTLYLTYFLMKRLKPDILNAGTPKAGLIGLLAGTLAGIPLRIYTLHGLRLETTQGPKRRVLEWIERLACACAHRVVCVSPSLQARVVELGLVRANKTLVLGSGTCNGLDATRFLAERADQGHLAALRDELGLPTGTRVIGFVGRFVKDKGMRELMEAFTEIHRQQPDVRLLLVGDYESGDPVSPALREIIDTHPAVVRAGFVKDTAPYYQLMTVLAFPTYREGFPTVILEASAAGLPVVATTATGARDAVIDNVTGQLVPTQDVGALQAALLDLLHDPEKCRRLGKAGRTRVLEEFRPEVLWRHLEQLYANT